MNIIAAVGEPDGRKANWLENARFLVGDKELDTENAGQRLVPRCLVRIGVTEIGLNSAGCDGDETLG